MTWSRFDDLYDEHEKVLDAWFAHPPNPVGLHVMATTACNRWLSDGVVRPRWINAMLPDRRQRETILRTMLDVELLDLLPAGEVRTVTDKDGNEVALGPFSDDRYVVHDFLDRHDSAAQVKARREWDARRKELERDRNLVAAIKLRDQGRCRYCGTLVNWRDRRGVKGGTYDHVIPRGDNSLENVVIACRRCNTAKGGRTPEQAGMRLLNPGDLAGPIDGPDRGQIAARSRPDRSTHPTQTPSLPDPVPMGSPSPSGRARTNDLAERVRGILQRGIDGLTTDEPCKAPTLSAVSDALARHPVTDEVALAVAVEVRSIAQSQNRAPNIAALFAQRLAAFVQRQAGEAAA